MNENAQIIGALALILFAAFLMTRITKLLKLPNVTGFIFAGILLGPDVLHLVSHTMVHQMEFVTDIALSFIAFGVGKYLKISTLKKTGKQVIIITVLEALMAALLITLSMRFLFHLPISFALLLGAIGSATAPASTIMTIRQYKAKGPFVKMILQVVALDDAVALIAFSVCAAVTQAINAEGALTASVFVMPILMNLLAIALGILLGFLLSKLISDRRTADNRLIITVSLILMLTAFCSAFEISPLLSCMVFGTTYINLTKNKALFKQLNGFTPPILTLFFVLSGMRLDLQSLKTAGIIGVGYFFIRIIGKYLGAYLGGTISGSIPSIRNYLGLALIPQAGVSIGLAVLGQRILPSDLGNLLNTIILSSAVLYEMVGPAASKLSLFLSRSIPDEKDPKKQRDNVPPPEQTAIDSSEKD